MNIIDAHTHIGLTPGKDVRNLLLAMDDAGVAKAAVFAAPCLTDGVVTTDYVLNAVKDHTDRLFVVAAPEITPKGYGSNADYKNEKIAEDWIGRGVRAFKFYTGYQHFYPNSPCVYPFVELLQKHNLPAIFHCGDTFDEAKGAKLKYAHPLAIDDLAVDMPGLKIIIAHMGSPWVIDAAQVCYKNKNVYTDCSGFTYGSFDPRSAKRFREMWKTFDDINEGNGTSKILFGTDWPISNPFIYVREVTELAGINGATAIKDVMHRNAEKVFNLDS